MGAGEALSQRPSADRSRAAAHGADRREEPFGVVVIIHTDNYISVSELFIL
ncbi:hypothetical protein GCM10009648_27220 [Tsukamurella spumae]